MLFQVGKFSSGAGNEAKKAAMEAAKQRALGTGADATSMVKYIPAAECKDRIRVIFDDSGSMGGQITNAKNGVVEFFRNCIPNQTAVAIHFMNTRSSETLRSDLPALGAELQEMNLSSGGTPFFNTMKRALEATPKLTRMVAFTDGSPTDRLAAEQSTELEYSPWASTGSDAWRASADVIITIAQSIGGATCIPIDTVFFGSASYSEREINLLKYLSEKTGGFFLHFDPAKPNIWKQLKYLAPVNRLRLTDGAFRAAVERGE